MNPISFILVASMFMQQLTPDQQEKVKLLSGKWMKQDQQAELLIKQKKYSEAEQIYLGILKQREELGLDLLSEYEHLANLYEASGDKEKAEDALKNMVAARHTINEGIEDQTLVYPLQQYAAMLERHGKAAEAKTIRARALRIDKESTAPAHVTNDFAQMMLEGERSVKSDNYDKALGYYAQAVRLKPEDPKALTAYADVLSFKEQWAKAKVAYDKAIKLDPKNAKAYVGRAWWHENQNKLALALTDFEKAIEINPKDTESMGSRAKLLDNMGRHKEAVEMYNKIIAINPDLYWPYIQRSTAYANMKQWNKAVADLTTLIKRAPEDSDFYQFRAETYKKAGDTASANADFAMWKKLSH